MDNWYDLQNNSISEFIRAYRDSLKAQRDSTFKQLQQQRKNAQASIMGAANRRGTLYSNFPQRDKIRYDAETYDPAYIKAQQAYTTGTDALKNNALTLWNKIKSYQEQIADYNNYGIGGGTSASSSGDYLAQLLAQLNKNNSSVGSTSASTSTAKSSGTVRNVGGGGGGGGGSW